MTPSNPEGNMMFARRAEYSQPSHFVRLETPGFPCSNQIVLAHLSANGIVGIIMSTVWTDIFSGFDICTAGCAGKFEAH